jgi:hypothetical protein
MIFRACCTRSVCVCTKHAGIVVKHACNWRADDADNVQHVSPPPLHDNGNHSEHGWFLTVADAAMHIMLLLALL